MRRIHDLYTLYFTPAGPRDFVPINAALAHELRDILARSADYKEAPESELDLLSGAVFDDATRAALRSYMGRENLEGR